jgi:hypothetical protein
MLGGYVARNGPKEFLLSTLSALEDLPDVAPAGRNAANYRVYWPTTRTPVVQSSWERTGTKQSDDAAAPKYVMRFAKSRLAAGTGLLDKGQPVHTGYTFKLRCTNIDGAESRMPAFPTRCPSCGDDWEYTSNGAVEDRQRTRSSIRTQGVGFDRANQVLTGALKRRLRSSLVVFSDSRQGAARVAANLELAHYLDLIRALVLAELNEVSGDLSLITAYLSEGDRGPQATAAFGRLQASNAGAAMAMMKQANGLPLDDGDRSALAQAEAALGGSPNLIDFVNATEPRLLALGVHPAGPAHSLQQTREKIPKPWTSLYTWTTTPVRDKGATLDPAQAALLRDLQIGLSKQIVRTVFAGGDRDVESLGLAYSIPSQPVSLTGLSSDVAEQVACSVIRIMAKRRRLSWFGDHRSGWPAAVVDYVKAVGRQNPSAADEDTLLDELGSAIGVGESNGYQLQPASVRLERARSDRTLHRCTRCRTRHLHESAGACIACGGTLSTSPWLSDNDSEAYYSWLAQADGGAYRLHCEELTGQTDPLEAQARQAQFQRVFLDEGEAEVVDQVDILSVTTTMEAGVDIGTLQGVVMANMPPQRFNYQQRVGRAGRRTEHLAVALTVCRGARSHDEHYFANPQSITGDRPPQPFLDMASEPIARRAFVAELLNRAFVDIADHLVDAGGGRSIHGQYGPREAWIDDLGVKQALQDWLDGNTSLLKDIAATLLTATTHSALTPDGLVGWAQTNLVPEMTRLAGMARAFDLSESLAQGGLLPMFGFPTNTRLLYTSAPRPGREASTLDRNGDLAIGEFAPGNEVVKDKAIHLAAGVVDYQQMANGAWISGPEPMGMLSESGICTDCLSISSPGTETCPVCGAVAPVFQQTPLAEPAGFRTSYRPRDYEQLSDPTARASQPRLNLPSTQPRTELNATAWFNNAEVVAVNDNSGRLFHFTGAERVYQGAGKPVPGLIEASLLADEGRARALFYDHRALGEVLPGVALAARRRTDVLVLGATTMPEGLSLDIRSPIGRGSWASLGYLLRDSAVKWLDIGTDEIEVGVHPGKPEGDLGSDLLVPGQTFIADSLANGAGYASRLGQDLKGLLAEAEAYATRLQEHGSTPCDSSCYQCLRDYSNRIWHALLDWRLGCDLLDVIMDRPLDVHSHRGRDMRALTAFAADFHLSIVDDMALPAVRATNGRTLGVAHPFEDVTDGSVNDRVTATRAVAPDVRITTSFDLIRRPGGLVSGLL